MVSLLFLSSIHPPTQSFWSHMFSSPPLLFLLAPTTLTAPPRPICSGDLVPFPFCEEPCMNLLESLYSSFSGGVNYRLLILCSMSKIHIWASTYHVPLWWLGYLIQDGFFKFHPFAWEFQDCIVFHRVVFHCVNGPHLLYPFFSWGASRLLPGSCYYK